METDAEEGLVGPGMAAMKYKVVACQFARCEVGNFKVELGDGAKGCKHVA